MKEWVLFYHTWAFAKNEEEKIKAVYIFLNSLTDEDKTYGLRIVLGELPKRLLTLSMLKTWILEETNTPNWLFEESLTMCKDVPEGLSLLAGEADTMSSCTLREVFEVVLGLRNLTSNEQRETLIAQWKTMDAQEVYLAIKLITGSYRIRISQRILLNALHRMTSIPIPELAQKVQQFANDTPVSWKNIIEPLKNDSDEIHTLITRVFTRPLETTQLDEDAADWQAIWNWNGISAQFFIYHDKISIWSTSGELLNNAFPELSQISVSSTGVTGLVGEIVLLKDGSLLNTSQLERRKNLKKANKKDVEELPAVFVVRDLIFHNDVDYRSSSFVERWKMLNDFMESINVESLSLADSIDFENWMTLTEAHSKSRAIRAAGMVVRKMSSALFEEYHWPTPAWRFKAVLLYIARETPRSFLPWSELTFGVAHKEGWIPVAKVKPEMIAGGLDELGGWVKGNTVDRFGPVLVVKPEKVFLLEFSEISESKRHKSGVVLSGVRLVEWLREASTDECASLVELQRLI